MGIVADDIFQHGDNGPHVPYFLLAPGNLPAVAVQFNLIAVNVLTDDRLADPPPKVWGFDPIRRLPWAQGSKFFPPDALQDQIIPEAGKSATNLLTSFNVLGLSLASLAGT